VQNRTGAHVLVILALAAALMSCATPRDAAYFLSHPTERGQKLQGCYDLASRHINTSSDPQCAAADEADAEATRAEHGPPFHNHDARWYRAHNIQQLRETLYCEDPRNRAVNDPDCDAASKGALPHF
jgi:hypothetical protein